MRCISKVHVTPAFVLSAFLVLHSTAGVPPSLVRKEAGEPRAERRRSNAAGDAEILVALAADFGFKVPETDTTKQRQRAKQGSSRGMLVNGIFVEGEQAVRAISASAAAAGKKAFQLPQEVSDRSPVFQAFKSQAEDRGKLLNVATGNAKDTSEALILEIDAHTGEGTTWDAGQFKATATKVKDAVNVLVADAQNISRLNTGLIEEANLWLMRTIALERRVDHKELTPLSSLEKEVTHLKGTLSALDLAQQVMNSRAHDVAAEVDRAANSGDGSAAAQPSVEAAQAEVAAPPPPYQMQGQLRSQAVAEELPDRRHDVYADNDATEGAPELPPPQKPSRALPSAVRVAAIADALDNDESLDDKDESSTHDDKLEDLDLDDRGLHTGDAQPPAPGLEDGLGEGSEQAGSS